MIRGIYTSAAGLVAAQQRMDQLAGNIANVSTTGFKQVLATQEDYGTDVSVAFGDGSSGTTIGRTIHDLEIELGRSPEESEIAARLGVSVDRYREQLAAASIITVSLDEPDPRGDDDDAGGYADTAMDHSAIDPGDEVARRDSVAVLAREISRLNDRPKLVLALYYQDELTFREIGEVLGVTESRVSQLHTKAILRLKGRLRDEIEPAVIG